VSTYNKASTSFSIVCENATQTFIRSLDETQRQQLQNDNTRNTSITVCSAPCTNRSVWPDWQQVQEVEDKQAMQLSQIKKIYLLFYTSDSRL